LALSLTITANLQTEHRPQSVLPSIIQPNKIKRSGHFANNQYGVQLFPALFQGMQSQTKNLIANVNTDIAPPAEHCHNSKNTTLQDRGKTTGRGAAIASKERHFSPLAAILENKHVTLFR
jgi:hypothetical protein